MSLVAVRVSVVQEVLRQEMWVKPAGTPTRVPTLHLLWNNADKWPRRTRTRLPTPRPHPPASLQPGACRATAFHGPDSAAKGCQVGCVPRSLLQGGVFSFC